MAEAFDRREGRGLFGHDPAAYDSARPGHAERVYEVLRHRCGLGEGTSVLEVGPGTGQATRRLLGLGARPLVALEPDVALARHVERALGDAVEVRVTPLEEAQLAPRSFDLAVAASSFHWIDEHVGLERMHGALVPGGWVALWWTLFGEGDGPDAFIAATTPLVEDLQPSPSRGGDGPPFALDTRRRMDALRGAGFETPEHETARWTVEWDTAGIRALYGTFSPIARLADPQRTQILDDIARIARDDFGGRVTRTLTTSLYTAHKPN
jgi:SAM-dependent methyltransferase